MDSKAFKWLEENQLSYDIWNKKYRFQGESFDEWLNRVSGNDEAVKQLIMDKKFLFGGRILANRGLNNASMANCATLGRVEDSIEGIMLTNTQLAQTFKSQQGQGVSLTNIRPKGATIRGLYPSEGIIPFMEIFNTTTESIQQGGSRRGALLMALDITHKDAMDFITIKSDLKRINNANLSLEINDEFMQAVERCMENKTNETMHCKKNYGGYDLEYDIDVMGLYNTLCEHALKYAEPGILYTDQLFNYNLMQLDPDYEILSTNACSEQPLVKHGMCMLSSINVSKYVVDPFSNAPGIDWEELEKDVATVVKAMDDIVDENLLITPLPEQKEVASKYRNIGIGVMGLADFFVMMNMKYGSEESKSYAKILMNNIFNFALKASAELAKVRGSFPGYKPEIWDTDIVKNNVSPEDIEQYKKDNVLRNCSLLSVAPTGSIGTMLQISTGCEPYFALSYKRRTISMGEQFYDVNIPTLDLYKSIKGEDADISNFVTAKDIHWKDRVEMQGALQFACDTAISSTCNLPKGTSLDTIKQIYLEAWRNKCKGFTVYVEGSRNPILSTSGFDANNPGEVAKRPKVLDADYYQVKVKGEQFAVIVGLLNGKPYEVFAFRIHNNLPNHSGKIIKVKKMHYKFTSDLTTIEDLQLANESIEERAATLYTSMLLRHNVDLKYILKTAKKVNDNIVSFSSAMCRVLAKYTQAETLTEKCPECGGELVREVGCCKCNSCGWARCE